MKKIFIFSFLLFASHLLFSQNVGIGTNSPNSKAILDIKATDKGILFPRLTSAQCNAITNPPDGLHIFNTDEHCLNFYDSVYAIWNCYCETDTCKTITIKISDDAVSINFYTDYGSKYPGIKKFVILIGEDVYITGTSTGPAIDFTTMPLSNFNIKILNYGLIYGVSGKGGNGAAGQVGTQCDLQAQPGNAGGPAIKANLGTAIKIINYGIVAGGGGGGGGGGKTALGQYGGGGGGGAGLPFAPGGLGGGNTDHVNICIPTCVCGITSTIAGNGAAGTNVTPGTGGAGANGGGNGGGGGALGQAGQSGTVTAAREGGAAGKTIYGGSGNSIINIGFGQSFGVVD
jgi:hypothetical protein